MTDKEHPGEDAQEDAPEGIAMICLHCWDENTLAAVLASDEANWKAVAESLLHTVADAAMVHRENALRFGNEGQDVEAMSVVGARLLAIKENLDAKVH